jgi:hypothetical protein
MRRTQLYLDDDLSNALHARARTSGTSISELVRQAVRERYFGKLDELKKAMRAVIGISKDRVEFADPERYVRKLRRGTRLDRLSGA